jgi:hypothetical protein
MNSINLYYNKPLNFTTRWFKYDRDWFVLIYLHTNQSGHIWITLYFCVGFEVFTAVTMKNAIFWDVYHVDLVWTDVSEECFASRVEKFASKEPAWAGGYPDNGGGMFLWHVGSHKVYMVPHPRRRHSLLFIFNNSFLSCIF